MKHSEFAALVNTTFGPMLGPAYLREQVLPTLGNRTAEAALAAGVEPRDVWHALCDALDAPERDRWGRDGKHHVPMRRR